MVKDKKRFDIYESILLLLYLSNSYMLRVFKIGNGKYIILQVFLTSIKAINLI